MDVIVYLISVMFEIFLFLNEMLPNFTHFTTEEDVGSWNKIPNIDIEILLIFSLSFEQFLECNNPASQY